MPSKRDMNKNRVLEKEMKPNLKMESQTKNRSLQNSQFPKNVFVSKWNVLNLYIRVSKLFSPKSSEILGIHRLKTEVGFAERTFAIFHLKMEFYFFFL